MPSFLTKLSSPQSLGSLAWHFVRALGLTLKIEEHAADERYTRYSDEPCIYALWHGRILLPILRMSNCGIIVLVSEHRDGEIVTTTLESAGFDTVRGSSTRGGVRALARLVKLARVRNRFAFTADGPKGPNWTFSPGAVFLAAKSGLPVIPITGSAKRGAYFKSWDKFLLPMPFTRAVVKIGEPYYVTGETDPDNIEYHRNELEKILIELTLEADKLAGATQRK